MKAAAYADARLEEAHALAKRINALIRGKDIDVGLGAIALVISAYLQTLPEAEREPELEDVLRLVRKLAKLKLDPVQ